MELTYIVPLRCDGKCGGHQALTAMLERLAAADIEVLVADGSVPFIAERFHRFGAPGIRSIALTPAEGHNGKVQAVCAGIAAASHERVIIADDDVLYAPSQALQLGQLLRKAHLVVPQNYFVGRPRWHTLWDTARTLLNRCFAHDFPGTLAIRRSAFIHVGGYDDGVLFENLELIRTIRAAGGRVHWADDVFIGRLAPEPRVFVSQRVRQAYDDLAQPSRLAFEASLLPMIVFGLRRPRWLVAGLVLASAFAEIGRRRGGAARFFSPRATLAAPLWVAERAVCVWIAIGLRLARGGVRYRTSRLSTAATSERRLQRRIAESESWLPGPATKSLEATTRLPVP